MKVRQRFHLAATRANLILKWSTASTQDPHSLMQTHLPDADESSHDFHPLDVVPNIGWGPSSTAADDALSHAKRRAFWECDRTHKGKALLLPSKHHRPAIFAGNLQ